MRTFLSSVGLCLLTALSACGTSSSPSPSSSEVVPAPTFSIDGTLVPHQQSIAGIHGGADRMLGSISGPTGGQADFVLNELAVLAKDRARVEALAARWGGKIIDEIDLAALGHGTRSYYLVSVNPDKAATEKLPADLQQVDGHANGTHRVSSSAALGTLAVAAAEAADAVGDEELEVAVNFVLESSGAWEGKSKEQPTGQDAPAGSGAKTKYSPNAYDWGYMKAHHVPEAWNALAAAGKLDHRVKIMVMDGGFVPNADLPAGATIYPPGAWKTPNPATCTGGKACSFHATDTVSAAMGRLDNGFGAAGPAAPIAELIAVQSPAPDVFQAIAYLFHALLPALEQGPRVINISATVKIPGVVGFSLEPADWIISALRSQALVFAAAGNTGEDVDHEESFWPVWWETDVFFPCEADSAVCVGGTEWAGWDARSPGSNYGKKQRVRWQGLDDPKHQDNSVDFYAPFDVWTVAEPDENGNIPAGAPARIVSGTSESTPFAAGIAALVFAANPALTPNDVYRILLETADDTGVMLRLDAGAAVKKALSGVNHPPQIKVTSPSNGASLGAGFQGVTFTAEVKDLEDGPDGVTVDWSSSQEGGIGAGLNFTHEFAKLGPHTITAVARDKLGASSQVSLVITLTDSGPTASVLAPTSGQTVYRNQPVALQGEVLSNFMHLPCTWTSNVSTDAGFPFYGCTGTVIFNSNGPRTLQLFGKDSYGISDTASVSFNVVDPPSNAPPGVAIASPTPNQSFFVGSLLALSGSAVDPDGKTPISYEWRFKGDNCAQEVKIATGANASWDTGVAALQKVCGTLQAGGATISLYATDPDNSVGVKSVHVYVAYNPN